MMRVLLSRPLGPCRTNHIATWVRLRVLYLVVVRIPCHQGRIRGMEEAVKNMEILWMPWQSGDALGTNG